MMINKKIIRQSLIKSISIITTCSFLFTGVFSEIAYASINIEKTNFNKEEYNLNTFIPSSIGRITSAKYYDSDEIIINIQDLHCHPETQKNIVKIIDQINKKYNLNEVYLEGAVGNVDTSLLSSLKKTELGNQIIESLLNLGRLSGAEYYSVVKDKNKFIVGIEDNGIYEENIQLLNQILSVYPDVSTICRQLDSEIKNVKKDYFNKDIRRLERLTYKFKKNKIDAKTYYSELEKIAKKVNEPLDKYGNVKLYVELLNKMKGINIEKISQQFKTYVTVLKSQIPYKQYAELSNMSNNFTSMENISFELLSLSKKYGICDKYNLTQLNGYLECLEFNKNINPINFVKEEKNLISNIYVKLGKTKYEQEVAFLADFIPTIKDYFTANITTEDYYRFKEKFTEFRNIWNSYFPDNTAKELDRYAQILSKYHENNLKRDKIFADILASSSVSRGSMQIKDRDITDIVKNKKIKLIITGGFHSKGLEKIFDERKISYVVITPKVTHADSKSNNVYLETIQEYVDILNDSVNVRPIDEEPLNISFPKILASAFVELNSNTSLSKEVKIQYINEIIKEVSQSNSPRSISLEKCSIDSLSSTDAKISVTYKDKSNNDMASTYEYLLDNSGTIQTYAQVDVSKTLDMIGRYFGNIKYAMPSVILEPSNSARNKIGKTVIESLKSVSGDSISFMPVQKLHITVAYDSGSAMSETQIDEAVNSKDVTNTIFADTEKLGNFLNSSKVPLEGKIKLMPDGAVILEITNEELVSQILGLRNILKKTDKYSFPKIVHMTLGRISDKGLLDSGNVQSRQQLAELVSKLNDKIYEINKQNELSKTKSSLTLKGGYISATGDRDYLVVKAKPSSQILSILNNLFINTKSITYKVYTCFIAPIWEETVFRFLPFMVTGLFISNTELVMPVLFTSISGALLFPLVHMIVGKKTSNRDNKNLKSLFISSAILTSSYLAISFIFPGMPLLALATSTVLHSIYNVLALRGIIKTKVLSIFDSKEINDVDKEISDFTSRVRQILTNYENKERGYNVDKNIVSDINSILYSLEKANTLSKDEKYKIFSKSVNDLFEFIVSLNTNKNVYFDLNYLLEPILISSVYVKNDTGNNLFDKLIEFEISEGKRTGSSRFKEQLIYMVEYFYSINKQYSYEILKILYENNILPLPSPSGFSSVNEWEKEISSIISKSKQYEYSYINMVEIFYPINKEYAYAILRALYKNGYCQKTPFVRFSHGYQWEKEFNSIISSDNTSDEPLLTFKNINDKELLEKYNISFNDIIARLQYIKKLSKYEKTETIHKQYDEILETLISAKDNSKNEKYKIVVEQMNILSNLLLSDVTKNRSLAMEMLETLAPVWLYIKYADSEDTLLNNVINLLLLDEVKNYKSGFSSNERVSYDFKAKFYRIFEQIYPIDKQFALAVLNKFHSIEPFAKYEAWMPDDIGDAYQNTPSEISDAIKKYEDLELFYEAVGIEWDDVNQKSLIYDKYFHTYDYMKILEMLPKNLIEQLKFLPNKPVYFRYKKSKYNSDNTKSKKTTNRFTFFNEILENNSLALEELNTTDARSMYAAIVFLEKMIDGLKQIDQQHGEAAQKALDNIKKLFNENEMTPEFVKEQKNLTSWTVLGIKNIKSLHTLINAVHQTAIADFTNIREGIKGIDKSKLVTIEPGKMQIPVYDFSDYKMRPEVLDFLSKLSEYHFGYADNKIMMKDGKLIWSKKLGVHSVDVLINFDDINEGIRVSYYDSSRGDGAARRVSLLAGVLSAIGFEITNFDNIVDTYVLDKDIDGVCGLKAVFRVENNLNVGQDFAEVFYKVYRLMSSTKNLDFALEGKIDDDDDKGHYYGQYSVPKFTLDDFKKLKGNLDAISKHINDSFLNEYLLTLNNQTIIKQKEMDGLESVYDYFEISKDKRNIETITRMFVEGKIIVNEDTKNIELNKKYVPMQQIVSAIKEDQNETLRQAQLINLIDYSNLNFVSDGYIGKMIAVSGILRLQNGWLSIKGVVDNERRRMKCAYIEYVDFEGNRRMLKYNELIELLNAEGYSVKQQKERSSSEKRETINALKQKISNKKQAVDIIGRGVSSGQGGYVSGIVTYNNENINKDSILVISYTTPDDIEQIERVKGLITTSGGMLSHANITAREQKKTALIANGQWEGNSLQCRYYTTQGNILEQKGFQTQEIQEHQIILKEGDRVLINGETGNILLFNDITREDLNSLQNEIDKNNTSWVKEFLTKHKNDKNIGTIVEYVYLQSINNEQLKKILEMLLSWEETDFVKAKIKELNDEYIKDKLNKINDVLANTKNIDNPNIAYAIIFRVEQQINSIKSLAKIEDIEELTKYIKVLKADVSKKLMKFIASFKSRLSYLLNKESWTEEEKEEAVSLAEMAKVWKYFYQYPGIETMVSKLEAKTIQSVDTNISVENEIKGFENIKSGDILKYGSKTTELAKITKLINSMNIDEVKVPYGIGLSKNVLTIFFEQAGKGEQYKKTIRLFEQAIIEGNKEDAQSLGKNIVNEIKKNDSEQLKNYISSLINNSKMYAVRSSGVGEDGATYAFAGMGETSLNVDSNDVYQHIKTSWESFFSYRSIDYMLQSKQIVMPAVLVQEMVVDVSKAGVIFTREENGDLTEEVVWGLGEGLVSGRINPDHISISLKDKKIDYIRALDNMKKVVSVKGGGTVQVKLTRDEKIERVIDESMIRKLSEIALELEKSVGYPIDIEFAIDQNNQIYILQRRPITTLAINETFAGTIENKQDIDQAIIDKLISDLNGISRDNNLAIILDVKETLKNLSADIIERYEIITEQINRLFDIIKSDSRTYKSYLVKYILPFIPFINLRGTGKSLINALLDLFPVDNKSDYYDAIKLSGDMIKQTYPLSIEKTIEIIKFLNQKDVISYREMPYSIKDALSEYKYDGLKSYYITVAESGIDKELADILIDENNKLKKLNILDSEINDKLKLYTKEFDFLSDKINISTVPLLEYQLNSLINDVVNNTSLEPENKSIIINSVLSISKQIIIKTNRIDKNILNKLSNITLESYNVNHNIKDFEQIITFFLFVVQNTNNFDKSETNNLAGEYLAKIALDIYAPVKSETGDEKEYHAREELCLSIFKQLSDYSPNNLSVYKLLFNTDNIPVSEYRFLLNTNEYNKAEGINLSEKTLAIFLNAVNNSKFTNVSCPIPYQDSDIIYSDKLIDMFVNSSKKLDIVSICRKLYSSGKNGKQIVFEIIKKLHEISGENWNIQTRIDAALSLASLASSSLYSIINDEQIFNIDKINKVFEELDAASFLKPTEAYISNIYGNSRYSENSAKDIYEFTSLIQHLPPEILSDADIVQKSPVYFRTDGTTNTKQKEVKKLVERFDTLQEILNYNALVLAMLDNSSGSMSEKDFNNIIDCLRKMIDGFIKINEKHGNESKQSLQKILNSMGKISSDSIKKQMTISKWDFDSIPDIEEIHTLINAVHQTSIYDFKKSIGDVSDVGNTHIKTITATQEDTSILAYDLSDKRINRDIINLIGNLVTKKIPKPVEGSGRYKIEDFICKDDMLVWTTRLFVHSVDVFMNFGNTDRGITIYYHEGGRNIGNAERVRYFTTILEKLGFNVEADMKVDQHDNSGVCGLKAVLNKDFGLDDTTNMVDIASRVILLFKYSNMLDWDLGGLYDMYSYTSYLQTFNNLVEKFIDGEIWVGYSPTSTDSFGDKGHNLTQRLEKPRANMTKFYNSILSYLGLDTLPETIKGWNLEQPKIDKYFNKYIERSYIERAIIFDEKGILKKNEKYDIMSSIIYEITSNVSETSKQSRIVNLINRYEFSFRTLGYVGSLIAVTGIMKLTNGDKLFVKGVMNPYTRRMKYAIVELVTTNGRKKLDSDELISLLSQEGYDISNQEWVGTRERKLIRNLLERNIQVIDSPEVRCTSTSDGNGIYVSGNITFDKNNVNNDSILVVPYTTPDDIEAIKTSRGIITTGGGILSHAAITTREYKKPSVVINGATWLDKEAEIQYYLSVGDVETIKNFQLQKVKVKNLVLKEGYRVLMNGETGTVLLFNDIDIKLLNELQSCIEENNQKSIINFMKKYEDNKDIRRLVEYVYFQSIGNSNLQQILFAVFSNEMPATVKTKIKELNESYIQDKIRNITEGIENIRSIDNVNISYGIIEMLSKKLNLIKTSDERADLKNLKEEITSLQREIKDRLFIYIKLLISDSQMYIEKKHLDIKDVRNIINMLNTANVYDFFVPSSEERTDLKDMSNILIQLMGQLEIKIKDYLLKDEIVGTNREITTFDNIYEEDGNKFGSKTTELAKMYRLLKNQKGVHIPNGMGVSVDVLELLFNVVGNKDGFMLKDFDNAIKNKDYSAAVQIAEKISSAIDDKNISAVRKEFENFLKNKISEFAIQGVKYSVRSSGVGEDGSSRAFAGMGETKLNVSSDNVYDSIKECWKSFFSERCISYMIESGQVVKPAVLVQEMVNVDKAGVVFSRNKYGNETIEVLYGLGEGLVSGTLTPDTIEVDIKNGEIIEYSVADKQFKIVATDDGTARETVEQGVKARTLDAKTVKQLTEIIRILEKDAGYPVDVEFGIKDGEIYILQRRAITTLDASSQENNNIIDNKNLNDKNELKQFITVITGDISKESDIFVNIPNPENSDEAISIYLKSTENNRSIFYVDSKYSHLIKDGRIISLLVERINTDSVIREKFNSNLSIFDRVDNGEIGILPIIDILDNSILEKSIDINIENIKSILSAA